MSSLKLNRYNEAEPFDLAIVDGSFSFADDKTEKTTMALQIVSSPIVNTVGKDTDELGGELLMDSDFLPKIEEFIHTSLTDNIDQIKTEIENAMNYVGVDLQDLNVISKGDDIFIEITPVEGETFNINF